MKNSLLNSAISFLVGILATLLGVYLSNYLENRDHYEKALVAVDEELTANIHRLNFNQNILEQDIGEIGKGKTILITLNSFQNSALDLLKIYLPPRGNPDLLAKVREVSLAINTINETIRSRQIHQTSNGAMSNYYPVLQTYDKLLLQQFSILNETLGELKNASLSTRGHNAMLINADLISFAGLVLDIFGALFLAKGFMAKRIVSIIGESTSRYGWNQSLRDSLVHQRVEAWIGGSALAVGFLLQSLPYILRIPKRQVVVFAFVLGFILLWIATTVVSKRISRKILSKIASTLLLNEIEKFESRSPGQVYGDLGQWAKRTGLAKTSSESDLEFQSRLKQHLKDQPRFNL